MGIVTEIFKVVSDTIGAFTKCLGESLTAVTSMFYTPENGLSLLGVLCVITIGVGIVYFVFRLLKGLIHHA